MFGSLPRSFCALLARGRGGSRAAFTIAAFDGFGVGVVSIQWLIWKSALPSPPRFGRQENSAGVLEGYGVSWMVSKAGWYQGTPRASFSAKTTTRWSESIISPQGRPRRPHRAR